MKLTCFGSNSKGNCYALEHMNEILILEAGIEPISVFAQLGNLNDKKVIGVLVTHEHLDHAKFVHKWANRGIPVYATKGTFSVFSENFNFKVIEYDDYNVLTSHFVFRPFKTFHDVHEPCGFVINVMGFGNILFETDTYKSPYAFKGLRWIMKEANYDKELLIEHDSPYAKRVIHSHMEIETTIKTIKQCSTDKLEKIILLHLSDGHSNEKDFQERVINATGIPTVVADKGVIVE